MEREIVVASGKGGTGKTFVASNLLYFLASKGWSIVGVDADVEAPDLVLALGGVRDTLHREEFEGAGIPSVNYELCIKCWKCVEACRFGAISRSSKGPVVREEFCEGWGTCTLVCPTGAITMVPRKVGEIRVARAGYGVPVVWGELELGGKSSGLLVHELKRKTRGLGVE